MKRDAPSNPSQPAPLAGATRRRWLIGGVAAAAAVAGAGWAWWRRGTEIGGGGDGNPADALWSLSFETPAGSVLSMAALRGRPLLLNFWATWCPPCVEELPLLDRFYRENSAKSWQVVGLAIDQPSSVRTFLARTPVTFPIALAGLGGTELGKSLGNAGDGLPFTVVVSPEGRVVQRRMGRLSAADLAAWSEHHGKSARPASS